MENLQEEHHATMTKREIWRVFFILLFITVIEFIIALAIPTSIMSQGIKNFLYVIMTLMKAFYIVAYFMHLKFERKIFQFIIVLNMIFMVYFIILLLIESDFMLFHKT